MHAEKESAMPRKSQKILILLGSPREDGNSTRLAFAFADAASSRGHAVQSIRVPALGIAPCDGCGECRKSAAASCALRDDMDSVYPLLRAADVLVFATPLHFYSWSTPLKTLVDRLYCLAPSRKRNLKGKKSVLLAVAADDRPAAFAGLKATYRLIAEYMGWKPLGEVLVPGMEGAGDISRAGRALARAGALGARLR
jgi:multimeric flavodoxin WrbA